jgi:hypothetical protein
VNLRKSLKNFRKLMTKIWSWSKIFV